MCITDNPLIKTLNNQKTKRMPIWLMRQAGRYLPEYLAIREKAEDFISFCLSPSLAVEATLQPLRRFDLDAAILFADILLVPHALGQKVRFEKGHGPKLNKLSGRDDINALQWDKDCISPTYQTVNLVRSKLAANKALIGFAGSPWTVACYMIDGSGGSFPLAKEWVQFRKDDLNALIDVLTDATISHLSFQIEAGVDTVQLFDSHAGQLSGVDFDTYVVKPTQKICAALREKYSNLQIIGFPRGASLPEYKAYAQKTGVAALSLDQSILLAEAKELKKEVNCLQGNLAPDLLLKGGDDMLHAAQKIFDALGPDHIFNLGHGVIKETPPEHVEDLVTFIHSLR